MSENTSTTNINMIHFSLILHYYMDINYAEKPFNMGMFFLPKASFKMGTFSDPQHTNPGILYTGVSTAP